MTNNAAARILRPGLDRFPSKAALIFQGRETTYVDLNRAAHAFAARLAARGINPSDRVALLLPDSPAFVIAFLGSLLHGAVPVPIGMTVPEADRSFILKDSGATLLVADESSCREPGIDILPCEMLGPLGAPAANHIAVPHEPTADDLAYMLYTSGSTGQPKGVPHVHADMLVPSATLGPAILGEASGDTFLSASKLSFSYGLMAQIGLGLASGATVLLHADPPDAKALPQVILTGKPTVFFAVPAIYDLLLRTLPDDTDLSFMRRCISSGEAMPAGLHTAWRERTGLRITELFGSTETLTSFMATRPERDTPGTLGHPVPGFAVRITDDTGQEVPDGEQGALHVCGPGIATSYWNRPEKSAQTMLADGWLDTGDLCVRTHGEIKLIGRTDDLFRSGGQWVIPLQVEDALLEHPAVSQCAVARCLVRGMAYPCAFVILTEIVPSPTGGELLQFAKKRLPRHMCPVKIQFMDKLPRTPTGKIQRHKLNV